MGAIAVAGAAITALTACGASTGGDSENTGGTVTYLGVSGQWESTDPAAVYYGNEIASLRRLVYRGLTALPISDDPNAAPVADLATDTGQANEDATQWSFTLKDGPKWQDGQPITCEDFKYGVSRTFATDVITGGPNYIIGYLDVPEGADGTPTYKGPYTGEGQADFDKAVVCDGNTITYHFKKPWPDFPLAIAALHAFAPYRADQCFI